MKRTVPENPVKLEWREDFIFKIDSLIVKINLWRLLKTLGKEFELQNLTFKGVHANIEKPNATLSESNSNVEYVLNFIDSLGLIPPPDEPAAAPKEQKPPEDAAKQPEDAAKQPDTPKIILRHIDVGNIGAHVLIQKVPVLGKLGFGLAIPELRFGDIQHDIFHDREDLTPSETIACIL